METEEKQYIKGFNNGYILAQEHSELLKKVTTNLDRNNPYNDGLMSGKEEFEIEKAKSYFKKFEKGKDSEKAQEKDKNKDDKGISR